MNNNNQNQLWTDSQKTRYFLIPENAQITEMLNVVTKLYIFKYSSIIKGKNVNIS
ncbi:MAG: hypothetical protein HEQ12_08275 [Aphanizomenon flos-aquae DEX188]|nr:MAG: hypothetical protein HEQ12_08275 [Aphanizomenon flos-aquae DEX188]